MNTQTLPTPERDIWEDIIAAGAHVQEFSRSMQGKIAPAPALPRVPARVDRHFIPPLPWRLFCILAGLPGQAWVLYLGLWRLSRMYHTTSLAVTPTCTRGVRWSRGQKTRALETLEEAGLLTVERQAGHHPTVTLRLEWETVEERGTTGESVEDFLRRLKTPVVLARALPRVIQRLDGDFIPPLPWRLFLRLADLPGKAWVLYLVLWRLSRMSNTAFLTATTTCVRGVGMSPDQKTRALTALEGAGLLVVERRARKNPQVTLCPLAERLPRPEPAP